MEFRKSVLKSKPWNKIKELKKDQLLIILLSGILLIVAVIPAEPKKDRKSDTEQEESQEAEALEESGNSGLSETYEHRQEERLKEALQKVAGVGKAEVMITLQASSEKVVEKDRPSVAQRIEESDSGGGSRTTQEENQSEETVYREAEDGSRSPYVIKELEPKVEGVIVIAEGGARPEVKQNILEAVQALFPVEAHKIKIMKMEGAK